MLKPTIELKNGQTMSVYEFARWASLVEAVDLIAEGCNTKGIDFNSSLSGKYIKPLDIQDYVDGRCDSMVNMVNRARDFERIRKIRDVQTEIKCTASVFDDVGTLPI